MKMKAGDFAIAYDIAAVFGSYMVADRQGYKYFTVKPEGSFVRNDWSYGVDRSMHGNVLPKSEAHFSSRRVLIS